MSDGMLFDRQSLPLEGRPVAGHASRSRQKLLVASRELEVGRAAEHLVCADLLLGGWSAYPTAQGMAYDLAVDTVGRVIRVQVKATYYPRHPHPYQKQTDHPVQGVCVHAGVSDHAEPARRSR